MNKRRWGALGLFAVAFNATCGGMRIDAGGQSGADPDQAGVAADDDGQTEARRSALVEPNIAAPALLATEPYGRLPGSGGVSLDGTYTYSVPIEVPPGRAGMAPSLSLAYSSRGSNGVVGMGWRVAGLSVISRCVKTTSAGGTRKGVAVTSEDDYCLDGVRLARTNGNQGAVNSEYRTETDMAAKIVVTRAGATGPQEWTVYFKSGRIATYARPSSEVWTRRRAYNADGSFLLAGEDVDMTWPIVKETDRAYNRIDYKYTMSHAADSSYPLPYRIEYTKCDQSPCAYPNAQIRRVEFVYTPIAQSEEYLTSYTNGVFLSLKKQLSEVHVSVQSGTSTTYNVVRKYKLRDLTPKNWTI